MKPSALAAGAAVSILLAACGSSEPTSTPAPAPAPTTTPSAAAGASQGSEGIVISSFAYSGTMTVKPGQEIPVTNKDAAPHTVTGKKPGLFDTGSIAGGGAGAFKAPDKAGSYPFGCTFHPAMAGTLTVQS